MDDNILFSKEVGEIPKTGNRLRLVVSEFMGVEYLSIREYYQSFEGDWLPAKDGFTIPLTLDLAKNFYDAFKELLES